jgi:porphobilinogen synthase
MLNAKKLKLKHMFPLHRGRRLRTNESIRFSSETTLSPSDFMFPMFIAEGENVEVEIGSMPGIFVVRLI